MHIYSCERDFSAMLTCIYVAWAGGEGHKNVKLALEPIGQYSLFDEYTHVDADEEKAAKVMDAVNRKISPHFYYEIAYCSMGYEDDVLDVMYRMMLMGFTYKEDALNMVQYGAVMRYKEIRRRLEREVCRFQEFSRFHLVDGHFYVAHIEPKSYLVVALGPIFADRMPSEDWMIVDDVHKEAVVHVKNSKYYLRKLTDEEFQRVLLTEKQNDEYTDLWKVFFDSIAIKERTNERCQNTLFPIWTRKHAVEFNKE